MERITGLRLMCRGEQYNAGQVAACSRVSRGMLRYLMEQCPVTYAQILYPYADALSLWGEKGTESTWIFGTHLLLRNIEGGWLRQAFAAGMAFAAADETVSASLGGLYCDGRDFPLTDGCAAAGDLSAFLTCECQARTVGDFGAMLGGFVPHWRVREAAKQFASFSEIAWRTAKGSVCGLAGGRLALCGGADESVAEKLRALSFQKTGVR